MQLPDQFWVRLVNGTKQKTWVAQPSEKRGYVIVQEPGQEKRGRLRIRPKPDTKLRKRHTEFGVMYSLNILVGKGERPGDLWWTDQAEAYRIESDPVDNFTLRSGEDKFGERMIELQFRHGYREMDTYGFRLPDAERLYKMLHASLYPEEVEDDDE